MRKGPNLCHGTAGVPSKMSVGGFAPGVAMLSVAALGSWGLGLHTGLINRPVGNPGMKLVGLQSCSEGVVKEC